MPECCFIASTMRLSGQCLDGSVKDFEVGQCWRYSTKVLARKNGTEGSKID